MTNRKSRGRPKGTPKTGGRKKGTPNKATVEVRELAGKLIEDPDYLAALALRLKEGKAGQIEPLLFHYRYGKPKETLEHSGPNGGPIPVGQVQWTVVESEGE